MGKTTPWETCHFVRTSVGPIVSICRVTVQAVRRERLPPASFLLNIGEARTSVWRLSFFARTST